MTAQLALRDGWQAGRNTASRLQNQCPSGSRQICALALWLALRICYG